MSLLTSLDQLLVLGYSVTKHTGRIFVDSQRGRTPKELYEHVFDFGDEMLKYCDVAVEVSGLQRLISGSAIICQNHTSMLDIPALLSFPGRKYFGTKKELYSLPIFGRGLDLIRMPKIDRKDKDAAIQSLDAAAEMVKEENAYLVIYPEGTRTTSYRMRPFKKGAFVLSMKTGLPIVPIVTYGGLEIMPKGQLSADPGTLHLRILDPLYPHDYDCPEFLLGDTVEKMQEGLDQYELAKGSK